MQHHHLHRDCHQQHSPYSSSSSYKCITNATRRYGLAYHHHIVNLPVAPQYISTWRKPRHVHHCSDSTELEPPQSHIRMMDTEESCVKLFWCLQMMLQLATAIIITLAIVMGFIKWWDYLPAKISPFTFGWVQRHQFLCADQQFTREQHYLVIC